jgi:Family of unknown function (DUF6807)
MIVAVALLALAQGAPIEVEVRDFDFSTPWRLVSGDGRREFPAQVRGGRLSFVGSGDVRLERGEPRVVRYAHQPVPQPDPVFTRSGYLHPVRTPSGRIVTNDSPPNHLHHHGIWAAWTSSQFEGRKSNFWESKEKQGLVEVVKVEETFSGPVFGGFKTRHRYVNLNGPDGPKTALEETWEVRVYNQSAPHLFELISIQTCATEQPVVIKEYRYGGVGFRGPADWEGKAGVEFLTSEGKNRIEGHATRAKWVLAWGKIGDRTASVGFLGHATNFRDPQPLRIHPDEPFFNWAVPQGGDFSIEPGKPYGARYRFVVADGVLDRETMERAWTDFNVAPAVRVTPSK